VQERHRGAPCATSRCRSESAAARHLEALSCAKYEPRTTSACSRGSSPRRLHARAQLLHLDRVVGALLVARAERVGLVAVEAHEALLANHVDEAVARDAETQVDTEATSGR
jgi:hypothetical protein